jgi:hypothetical protein
MRYVFGCAVLCLGLSAADALPAQAFATSSGNDESVAASTEPSAAAFTPSQMIEEAQNPRSADEPTAGRVPPDSNKKTVSLEEICDSVAFAAQAHDLPIAFLASLVWQESRFRPNAVSPVGAQGIAQFMPKVAAAFGLADPFDPLQALPASAKLLRELYQQFGNLGLAAAAYNAGPKRVLDWLNKRGKLPGETRTYVLNITGRRADQWMSKDDSGAFKIPARTPCQALASLPEWSSAGSGQLDPDLPDAAPEKPMIVITKTKVIVTGPNPKTLAFKQAKTKVAAEQPKTKVADGKKEAKAKPIVVTKSKVIITGESKVKLASAEKLKLQQPKSIMAPEPKSRSAEADKNARKAGKSKTVVADAKPAGKGAGKNARAGRAAAGQRVRTAAAG